MGAPGIVAPAAIQAISSHSAVTILSLLEFDPSAITAISGVVPVPLKSSGSHDSRVVTLKMCSVYVLESSTEVEL